MKKQILFVALFTFALLIVSNSGVLGQTNPLQPSTSTALTAVPVACQVPTPITCPGDALHPIPGNPYAYSIQVPTNLGTGTFRYRWFVTQDPNIITTTNGVTSITSNVEAATGTGLFVQSAVDNYNDIAAGSNTITITWKSFVHNPALPVLVAIYVEGNDGCLTNNVEVYEIQPIHAFTLDIANISSSGDLQADLFETCVSPVQSAIYTAGSLTMDYGTNYLYYAVTAANFTGSWMPNFQVTGAGTRTVTTEWQYSALSNVATGWHAVTDPVVASGGANASVGAAGECIIVRVTIDNNDQETIADTPITLAVDGIMNDPTTPAADYTAIAYADIHYADCLADGFNNDHITQILAPRPDLTSTTPGIAPPYTNPEPFEPKN